MSVFWEEHTDTIFSLRMEAECSSETSVRVYKPALRYYPKDKHRHLHRHENLKSHKERTSRKKFLCVVEGNTICIGMFRRFGVVDRPLCVP
jgi:hypothetical protein